MLYKSLDHFLQKQSDLLKIEQECEVDERKRLYENVSVKVLEKRGVCVQRLRVDQQRTGLYGRFIVKFVIDKLVNDGNRVAVHKISSGDIVGLQFNKAINSIDYITTGLVCRSDKFSISISFDEEVELTDSGLYRVVTLTNDVTYRRLKNCVQTLKPDVSSRVFSRVADALFPCKIADSDMMDTNAKELKYFNENLDSSQQSAVSFVLHTSHPISVIHGPPGTGKSTTVVEVIQQAVKSYNMKVLVCAPSNIAVDNLVERLSKTPLKIIRLGHPARIEKSVQKHCLDAILMMRDTSEIIKSIRQEISAIISKFKNPCGKTNKFEQKDLLKELRKDLRTREKKAMTEVLKDADVVLSTTTSASMDGPLKHLKDEHFDVVIIDEAGQAMEISCWIPMLLAPKCILAGDHKQLPPTIISDAAAKKGLSTTLLDRVVQGIGEKAVCMLTTQYRMHQLIMKWPSETLYNAKLQAAHCVKEHLLTDFPHVENTTSTGTPLFFVDTAGCDMFELSTDDDQSKGNLFDVDIINAHVIDLCSAGVKQKNIGIITPYNMQEKGTTPIVDVKVQVDLLRKRIHPTYPDVEVNTVDGFQGREKEAILISMVRSNEQGEVGFLSEDRRTNVAITRARRHLFVVGDSQTLSRHKFLASLCSFLHENAEIQCARTYINSMSQDGEQHQSSSSSSTAHLELPESMLNHSTNNDIAIIKAPLKSAVSKDLKAEDIPLVSKEQEVIESNHLTAENDVKPKEVERKSDAPPAYDIEAALQEFIKSSNKKFSFPATLSSKERALCHERAEALQIHHESSGQGNLRHIVVRKKVEEKTDSQEINQTTDATRKCSKCMKIVPIKNFDLHSLRCEQMQLTSVKPKTTQETGKKKKKKKKSKDVLAEEENIDKLLESFATLNSKCSFDTCSKSIKTLGQKCAFCSLMFCLSHHMAEIHGCGNAVKIQARRDISKYQGKAPSKLNDVKKVHVHKKLDNKLKEMENNRKKKGSENKK